MENFILFFKKIEANFDYHFYWMMDFISSSLGSYVYFLYVAIAFVFIILAGWIFSVFDDGKKGSSDKVKRNKESADDYGIPLSDYVRVGSHGYFLWYGNDSSFGYDDFMNNKRP